MSLTSNLRQFQSAARLEQILGSVHDTNNDFSWSAAIERDEKEQYPQRAVDFLNAVGMNRFMCLQSSEVAWKLVKSCYICIVCWHDAI